MYKTLGFASCVLLFLMVSCSPYIIYNPSTEDLAKPWDETSGFVVYDMDETLDLEELKEIGTIKVTDGGFSVNCDYYSVVNELKNKAKEVGGNVFQITRHKEPDLLSSCHRISGKLYLAESLWQYEKEILWVPNRKLRFRDFKGDTRKRPGDSRTVTELRYFYEVDSWKNRVLFIVESYFDCESSYFMSLNADPLKLRAQQYLFDLSEIHTRKFKSEFTKSRINSLKMQYSLIEEAYENYEEQLSIQSDELISDLAMDPSKEEYWRKYIEDELKATEYLARIKIPIYI